MNPEETLRPDAWTRSSSGCESLVELRNSQPFTDSSFLDYGTRIEEQFSDFNHPYESQNSGRFNVSNQKQMINPRDRQMSKAHDSIKIQDWDPRMMLNDLSFLEKKIHGLQDLVHLVAGCRGPVVGQSDGLLVQQQQLITADLTSIIIQLISTTGNVLSSMKHTQILKNSTTELGSSAVSEKVALQHSNNVNKVEDQSNKHDISGYRGAEENCAIEDHETRSDDDDDADEGENLPPGSYQILQLEKEEILASHNHFCVICGKGFKRDANLRMHMRGHGEEYKSPAALAKPHKESSSGPTLVKRYSCPYLGCKRNKDHKKFRPLKSILCVKNHYKRTHCDKSYTCSRCNTKKFSVIADLKTHEKHCGRDKWLCSCGTTFSRKDKLFGHIALFQGHTPAIPVEESSKESAGLSDHGQCSEATYNVEQQEFNVKLTASSTNVLQNVTGIRGTGEDPTSYFSSLCFDASRIGGFHEFPQPPFDDSESPFSFPLSGSCNYPPSNGTYFGPSNLE